MNRLKRMESIDSGSNYKFGEKLIPASFPRSLFDLSHTNTLTIPNGGMCVPVAWFETLPQDDIEISMDALIRVLAPVVPLMSRQRLFVYAFWNRYHDLWNNAQVFMSKGYTGKVNKHIPYLQNGLNAYKSASKPKIEADEFAEYLGLPVGTPIEKLIGSNINDRDHIKISALLHMQALRIARDYFWNKDEFIEDRIILPDDDSRFRLNDNGQLLSATDNSVNFFFSFTNTYDLFIQNGIYYFSGFCHEWADDRFTTAKPFTQRGNAPYLQHEIDLSSIGIDFSNTFDNEIGSGVQPTTKLGYITDNPATRADVVAINSSGYASDTDTGYIISAFERAKLTGTNIGLKIYLEDIRELAIAQQELERMALTDGSYAQFGLTFFGEVSKGAYDFKPVLVGATYKNIVFTEVLQTSGTNLATSEGEDATPLGTMAGHGITGMDNQYLGRIHCDDYGQLMIFACIMPDVYYFQGIPKTMMEQYQAEKYLPDRAKLGMQPVLNCEVFYAGNNSSDSGGDLYLWAYQNAFDHLRYMENKIHGKIADSTNNSFFPYTQARKFDSLPNWGRNFSEAYKDSIRKDYLSASTEDAYICQFKFNIRAVRPIPYRQIPAQIV